MTSSPSSPPNSAPRGSNAHVGWQPVAGGDVGRVGDDGVGVEAGEQVAVHERDLETEALRVRARDIEGVSGDVRAEHLEVGPLVLQCKCDGARARAHVDHPRLRRQGQRGLDHELGLRSWDEHARVDREHQTPEPLLAEDVRHRLAPRRRGGEVHERARLVRLELAPGRGDDGGAADPQHVREQELGVEPRRVAAGGGEGHVGRVEGVAHGGAAQQPPGHQVAASSRARFSASCSAAVCSSSAPPSTSSRLWTVSFTRWSVTRRSGKL